MVPCFVSVAAAGELCDIEAGAREAIITGFQCVSKGRQSQDTADTVQVCEHVIDTRIVNTSHVLVDALLLHA